MRGVIDLSGHKLAHVFRAPARSERWKAYRPKARDEIHRQLVRLIDGAVRDCFANHPEYLTTVGQRNARSSVIKRVAGTIWGYGQEVSFAVQTARGRSIDPVDAPMPVAADQEAAGVRSLPSPICARAFEPDPTTISEVVVSGGSVSNVPADNPVLVVRTVLGRESVAIDWRGVPPARGELHIPITAEQAAWPLADLHQAYELRIIR